jgi:hypothetical protein
MKNRHARRIAANIEAAVIYAMVFWLLNKILCAV